MYNKNTRNNVGGAAMGRNYTTHVRKDYHTSNFCKNNYYELDDFDNPNAWEIKEIDMLDGMGFKLEGNSRLGLTIPDDVDMNKYEIAKHKELGYELLVNQRKHYFKTFDAMLDHIDKFGKLDL